jgi:hypothetical protein
MTDQKVASEVAVAEFERFLETMDLDIDTSKMDADDLKSFDEAKRKLVRAIERGHLVVDDKGQPVYTPQGSGTAITFFEPTGASFMATDGKKKGYDVAKMNAMLGDITKQSPVTFAKMAGRDYKICQTILVLFLG